MVGPTKRDTEDGIGRMQTRPTGYDDGSGNVQAVDSAHPLPVGAPLLATSDLSQAAISFSTSGDQVIVAAVSGQTTRVHRMILVVAPATNITIKNGAGTSLTGAMPLGAGGAIVLDFSNRPWFKTSVNTAFIINSSAAVQVGGMADYVTSA